MGLSEDVLEQRPNELLVKEVVKIWGQFEASLVYMVPGQLRLCRETLLKERGGGSRGAGAPRNEALRRVRLLYAFS